MSTDGPDQLVDDEIPEGFSRGFDDTLAGKYAECDGGYMDANGHTGRDDFAGIVTGLYVEEGDPPTRWYLLAGLTKKPENYLEDAVWCERSFLFFEGEQ